MALNSKKIRLFIALIVIVLGAGTYWLMHMHEESTDDAQIDSTIVTISPKVSGYVVGLHINDNTAVKKGDPLLEIDPTDYTIRRDRAAAAVQSGDAQVAIAQANFDKAQKDLERVQKLGKLASSVQQVDDATNVAQTTEAVLNDSKAKLELAKSDLAQAEKDLADTKMMAPIDGKITKRGVEEGDFVQPGQQLTSIVASDFNVQANFKENQLEHMRVGQKADIEIDAFPGKTLTGTIESFQSGTGSRFSAFPPENATGNFVKIVQRVPVKIVFDKPLDPKIAVGPGMSVLVTVHTK